MGRRGPPPTPKAILRLAGSEAADKIKDTPDPGPAPNMKPPKWLTKKDYPEAFESWQEYQPELVKLGVLTVVDRDAFARLCVLKGRWRKAEKAAGHYDLVGPRGTHAAWKEADALAALVLKHEAEFGLTPASRTRVRAQPKKSPGRKSRFFAKNKGA